MDCYGTIGRREWDSVRWSVNVMVDAFLLKRFSFWFRTANLTNKTSNPLAQLPDVQGDF